MTLMLKLFAVTVLVTVSLYTNAQVRLPSLIANGMVLQRDIAIPLWGWAKPGEKIIITFNHRSYRTITNSEGKWNATLRPVPAGGPYTLEVKGSNSLRVSDILAGDVFVCSGQSNMVLPMERVKERYDSIMKTAHYPAIRQFFVPPSADLNTVHDDSRGKWTPAVDSTLPGFSATAFFFAREIYERFQVPVGLINVSVGGSPVEAWLPAAALSGFPSLYDTVKKYRDTAWVGKINRAAYAFNKLFTPTTATDSGLGGVLPWFHPDLPASDWTPFQVPGYWSDQGVKGFNGVAWFRKEIYLPDSLEGRAAKLFVGRIVDADEVFVNGVRVGNITYQYPPRRYTIPTGLLKKGRNVMVVRIINTEGKGGFVPDKNYALEAGQFRLDLRGEWKWKIGQVFPPIRPASQISIQNFPTALYNTMIAPNTWFPVKAILWYQGEANTNRAHQYQPFFSSLIASWRQAWGNEKLPFLFVQLPGFMERGFHPGESNWASLRDAQLKATSIPYTGMAVTIDLGEWNDIHPLNKRDVGKRLALLARKIVYKENNIIAEGPRISGITRKDDKLILSFSNAPGGVVVDLPMNYCFEIAGADKKFVWAQVRAEENRVILSETSIPHPVYARYAWSNNPVGCSLSNKEGLLASPFHIHLE